MNADRIFDALGQIDDALIEQAEILRIKKRKPCWTSWVAIAACFAVLITLAGYMQNRFMGEIPDVTTPSTEPIPTQSELVVHGVNVNHAIYMPDDTLSEFASEKNVGEFVGYVSLDNKTETDIRAFSYLPVQAGVSRIIIRQNGGYQVYVFDGYVPDGTKDWPLGLLTDVYRIEIRNVDREDPIIYRTIVDENKVADMVEILRNLGEKHDLEALYQRKKEYVQEYVASGKPWTPGTDLIVLANKDIREFVVIKRDGTKLYYTYFPTIKAIQYYDFSYFLSATQVEQINVLVDLQ